MTDLERCKAQLREDAARLCEHSKHPDHPFGDCPCSCLRVIEGLEAALTEARRDTARLGWLGVNHAQPWQYCDETWDVLRPNGDSAGSGATIRDAIDAAMGGESDGLQ